MQRDLCEGQYQARLNRSTDVLMLTGQGRKLPKRVKLYHWSGESVRHLYHLNKLAIVCRKSG